MLSLLHDIPQFLILLLEELFLIFNQMLSIRAYGRHAWGRPPDKSAYWINYFLYFSSKTYVVGTQKNGLNETVLLSTKNTCLY